MSEKTGIEKLRSLPKKVYCQTVDRFGTVYTEKFAVTVTEDEAIAIADQIEREHLDALNEKIETICNLNREADSLRENRKALVEEAKRNQYAAGNFHRERDEAVKGQIRLEKELKAKHNLTDEAREAVERLRMVSHDDVLRSVNPEHEIVDELCKAVGVVRRPTYTGTFDAISDRLIELIEHGGKLDVDAAALQELADDLESLEVAASSAEFASGYEDGCEYAAERIRKAVEGAPKSGTVCECETHMQDDNSCVGECSLCERNGMVEWVEEHGGLEAVQERIDSFARMLNSVDSVVCGDEQYCFGERVDLGEADELFGVIYGELDKRLMPPGVEWPSFSHRASWKAKINGRCPAPASCRRASAIECNGSGGLPNMPPIEN